MATVAIFKVDAGINDQGFSWIPAATPTQITWSNAGYPLNDTYINVSNIPAPVFRFRSARMYVPGVEIPAGSTVVSASARFYSDNAGAGGYPVPVSVKQYVQLQDQAAPGALPNNGGVQSTASTPGITLFPAKQSSLLPGNKATAPFTLAAGVPGFLQRTVDVTSYFQTLYTSYSGSYNAPGGSPVVYYIQCNDAYIQRIRAYEYSSGAQQAELVITYEAGGGGGGGGGTAQLNGKFEFNGKVEIN